MIDKARTFVTCIALLTCFACDRVGAGNQATAAPPQQQKAGNATAPGSAAVTEADALARARETITKYRLTSLPVACLTFMIESASADIFDVEVYERHNAQCGGDPQVQPRLFGLQISRKNAKVWTDAKSDDGEFELLTQ